MDFNKCFICKNSSEIKPLPMHIDAYRLSCPICGTYEITGAAAINIDSIHHDLIHILSAVARLASEHKTPIRISAENLEELINSAQVPDGPLEMIDKILLYTSRKSKTFNELVKLRSNDYPICFSRNGEEFFFPLQ